MSLISTSTLEAFTTMNARSRIANVEADMYSQMVMDQREDKRLQRLGNKLDLCVKMTGKYYIELSDDERDKFEDWFEKGGRL